MTDLTSPDVDDGSREVPVSRKEDEVPTGEVVSRVMANQMLFQSGNSLTTGSFFNYFVAGFQPSALWLAVLMVIPETMQALSVLGQRLCLRFPDRKRTWLTGMVVSRLFALLIPLSLLFPDTGDEQQTGPLLFIAGCTTGWYLAQGLAYMNYLSWLSALAPRHRWGYLFSWRQIAGLLIAVGVPLGTLALRRQVLSQLPDSAERWSYALLFALGGLFVIASTFPLLALPEIPLQPRQEPSRVRWRKIWGNAPFRFLLASRWTAAFFQGLTQAVLFKYAYDILKLSIETYMGLISLMLCLQLPVSWGAGKISDAQRDRSGMFLGLLLASAAMPCWYAATPETWWWLIVAYACWSSFALVNVCGMNFCLKLASSKENLGHVALYEQVSGLIAGMAGLLGGALLDRLLTAATTTGTDHVAAYHWLILISWLGRTLAPLWLLAIRTPPPDSRS